MAVQSRWMHCEPMVEIVVVAVTALAFLAIVAAVPIELGEEIGAEHERRTRADQR